MPTTRRHLLTAALALPLIGCPKIFDPSAVLAAARPGFSANSKVHAYQSWAFVYGFAMGNATQLRGNIRHIQEYGLPLLDALRAKGATVRFVAETYPGSMDITAYAIHMDVTPKRGRTIRIPGKQGADPAVYLPAVAQVEKLSGLSTDAVQKGQGAWYGLTYALTGLDAEATTLRKHAFALKVMQERVQNGEKADWFDGLRPAEQTIADADMAIGLITQDVERVRSEQAAILALLSLVNHYEVDGVPAAFREELAFADQAAAEWLATHKQPTPGDFGVEYKISDPKAVQAAVEDQLGIVGSALKIAKGVATGSLPTTLDGLAGLAPKDTKLKAVAEGLAAASKGDISGTLGAIADLGGPETKVGRIASRLETVAGVLKL
jgi:hypothetical protein